MFARRPLPDRFLVATLLTAGFLTLSVAAPPAAPTSAVEFAPSPRLIASDSDAVDLDRRIIRDIQDKAEVLANLEHLCDRIGPRVTGSANLERANKWAAEKMKAYGLENVRLEPWEIPAAWERGSATMKLVEPATGKYLTAASMGWTPGTRGKVTGEVVVLNAQTKEELAKYKGQLKGAIVLRSPPAVIAPVTDLSYGPASSTPAKKDESKKGEAAKLEPKWHDVDAKVTVLHSLYVLKKVLLERGTDKSNPELIRLEEHIKEQEMLLSQLLAHRIPTEAPTSKNGEPRKTEPPAPQPTPRPSMNDIRAMRQMLGEFLRTEGVAAIVIDSGKPHGLLTMTGAWQEGDRGNQNEQLPTLFMTHEHYAMLYRLASDKNGSKPRVELEVTNTFIPGPVTVFNTVGEIRGSEKPDEFVVIGAHLDSWDLGSGATDNGTGSCIVLEVARTLAGLAKQGVRPKRTIRFVLFSGEEQGLFGSRQYVKKHKDELPKTSMALVHDTGTGKVQSFGLQGREAIRQVLEPQLSTLKELSGWQGLTLRSSGGTDHLSFEAAGVPGFACQQDIDEYRLTHHTQTDTFDHIKGPNLVQGAQAIAVTAMRVANLPELLPRQKKDEPKKDDSKKTEAKKEEPKKAPAAAKN